MRCLPGGYTFRSTLGYPRLTARSCSTLWQRGHPLTCDAILMVELPVMQNEPETKKKAKVSLEHTLQSKELKMVGVKGRVVVGNDRGLGFMDRFSRFEEELQSLKASLNAMNTSQEELQKTIVEQKVSFNASQEELQKTIVEQKASFNASQKELQKTIGEQKASFDVTNASQEERIQGLARSSDSYLSMRDRFISTYKRNHGRGYSRSDERKIDEGNAIAHGGDAVSDATLYAAGPDRRRTDNAVFKHLYGIYPSNIDKIKHSKTIDVLNSHASVLGSDFLRGSKKFTLSFKKFVNALEKSAYDEKYVEGKESDVTRAYREFVHCRGTEVTELPPRKKRSRASVINKKERR